MFFNIGNAVNGGYTAIKGVRVGQAFTSVSRGIRQFSYTISEARAGLRAGFTGFVDSSRLASVSVYSRFVSIGNAIRHPIQTIGTAIRNMGTAMRTARSAIADGRTGFVTSTAYNSSRTYRVFFNISNALFNPARAILTVATKAAATIGKIIPTMVSMGTAWMKMDMAIYTAAAMLETFITGTSFDKTFDRAKLFSEGIKGFIMGAAFGALLRIAGVGARIFKASEAGRALAIRSANAGSAFATVIRTTALTATAALGNWAIDSMRGNIKNASDRWRSLKIGALFGLFLSYAMTGRGLRHIDSAIGKVAEFGAVGKTGSFMVSAQRLAATSVKYGVEWIEVDIFFNTATTIWNGLIDGKFEMVSPITGQSVKIFSKGWWQAIATTAVQAPKTGRWLKFAIGVFGYADKAGVGTTSGILKVAISDGVSPGIFTKVVTFGEFLVRGATGRLAGWHESGKFFARRILGIFGSHIGGFLTKAESNFYMAGFVSAVGRALGAVALYDEAGTRIEGRSAGLGKIGRAFFSWAALFMVPQSGYTDAETVNFAKLRATGASSAARAEINRLESSMRVNGLTQERRVEVFSALKEAMQKVKPDVDMVEVRVGGRTYRVTGLTSGMSNLIDLKIQSAGVAEGGEKFLGMAKAAIDKARRNGEKEARVRIAGQDVRIDASENSVFDRINDIEIVNLYMAKGGNIAFLAESMAWARYDTARGEKVLGDISNVNIGDLAGVQIDQSLHMVVVRMANANYAIGNTKEMSQQKRAQIEKWIGILKGRGARERTEARKLDGRAKLARESGDIAGAKVLSDKAEVYHKKSSDIYKNAQNLSYRMQQQTALLVGKDLIAKAVEDGNYHRATWSERRAEARKADAIRAMHVLSFIADNENTFPMDTGESFKKGSRPDKQKTERYLRREKQTVLSHLKSLGLKDYIPQDGGDIYRRTMENFTEKFLGKGADGLNLAEAKTRIAELIRTIESGAQGKGGLSQEARLRLAVLEGYNAFADAKGKDFKLQAKQVFFSYVLGRTHLSSLNGKGVAFPILSMTLGGGKMEGSIIGLMAALKAYGREARVAMIADASKGDLVGQALQAAESVAKNLKDGGDIGLYRLEKPGASDLGLKTAEGNSVARGKMKRSSIIFTTETLMKEHYAVFKESKGKQPSIFNDAKLRVHIDEVQSTFAANDLIKSSAEGEFKKLTATHPALAMRMARIAGILDGSFRALEKILVDGKGQAMNIEALIKGRYFITPKGTVEQRGAFTLNRNLNGRDLLMELWKATKNNECFSAYHKNGSVTPTKEFARMIERVVTAWAMNDSEYRVDKYGRIYAVRDGNSGEEMPDTIFGDNIVAGCIAAKHGFGAEKIADVLIQKASFEVSTAEWMARVGRDRMSACTGTPNANDEMVQMTGASIHYLDPSTDIKIANARFMLAEGASGVRNIIRGENGLIKKRLLGMDSIKSTTVSSRNAEQLIDQYTASADLIAKLSPREKCDVFLILRETGNAVELPRQIVDYIRGLMTQSKAGLSKGALTALEARQKLYTKACNFEKGAGGRNVFAGVKTHVNYETAVGVVKGRFNEGFKTLAFVQGLSAGSNIYGIELTSARGYKADVVYLGLTGYDNLTQAFGRINDATGKRAQGGKFIQIVDVYDKELKTSEMDILLAKGGRDAFNADCSNLDGNMPLSMRKTYNALVAIQKGMNAEVSKSRAATFIQKAGLSAKEMAVAMAELKSIVGTTLSAEKAFMLPTTIGEAVQQVQETGLSVRDAYKVVKNITGAGAVTAGASGLYADGQQITYDGALAFTQFMSVPSMLGTAENMNFFVRGLESAGIGSIQIPQLSDLQTSLNPGQNLLAASKALKMLAESKMFAATVPVDRFFKNIISVGAFLAAAKDQKGLSVTISPRMLASIDPVKDIVEEYKEASLEKSRGSLIGKAVINMLEGISGRNILSRKIQDIGIRYMANAGMSRFMHKVDLAITLRDSIASLKSQVSQIEELAPTGGWQVKMYVKNLNGKIQSAQTKLDSLAGAAADMSIAREDAVVKEITARRDAQVVVLGAANAQTRKGLDKATTARKDAVDRINNSPTMQVPYLRLFVAPDITSQDVTEMKALATNIGARNEALLQRMSLLDLYNLVKTKVPSGKTRGETITSAINSLADERSTAPIVLGATNRIGNRFYNFITGRSNKFISGTIMDTGIAALVWLAPPIGVGLAIAKNLTAALTESIEAGNIGGVGKGLSVLLPQLGKAVLKTAMQSMLAMGKITGALGLGQAASTIAKWTIIPIYAGYSIFAKKAEGKVEKGKHAIGVKGLGFMDSPFKPLSIKIFESPAVAKAKDLITSKGQDLKEKDLDALSREAQDQALAMLNPINSPDDTRAMISALKSSVRGHTIETKVDAITARLAALPAPQAADAARAATGAVGPRDSAQAAAEARAPPTERQKLESELKKLSAFTTLPGLIAVAAAKANLDRIAISDISLEGDATRLRYDVTATITGNLRGSEHNILMYMLTGDEHLLARDDIARPMAEARESIGTLGNTVTLGALTEAILDRSDDDGKVIYPTTIALLAIEIADKKAKSSIRLTAEEVAIVAVAKQIVELPAAIRNTRASGLAGAEQETQSGITTSSVKAFIDLREGRNEPLDHDTMHIFFNLMAGKPDMSVPGMLNDYVKKEIGLANGADDIPLIHIANANSGREVLGAIVKAAAVSATTLFRDPITRNSSETLKQYNRLVHAIEIIDDPETLSFIQKTLFNRSLIGAGSGIRVDVNTLFVDGEYLYVEGAHKGLATALLGNKNIDKKDIMVSFRAAVGAMNDFDGTNGMFLSEIGSFSTTRRDMINKLDMNRVKQQPADIQQMLMDQIMQALDRPFLSDNDAAEARDIVRMGYERRGDMCVSREDLMNAVTAYRKALEFASDETASKALAVKAADTISAKLDAAEEWTDKVTIGIELISFLTESQGLIDDQPARLAKARAGLAQLKSEAAGEITVKANDEPLLEQIKMIFIRAIDKALAEKVPEARSLGMILAKFMNNAVRGVIGAPGYFMRTLIAAANGTVSQRFGFVALATSFIYVAAQVSGEIAVIGTAFITAALAKAIVTDKPWIRAKKDKKSSVQAPSKPSVVEAARPVAGLLPQHALSLRTPAELAKEKRAADRRDGYAYLRIAREKAAAGDRKGANEAMMKAAENIGADAPEMQIARRNIEDILRQPIRNAKAEVKKARELFAAGNIKGALEAVENGIAGLSNKDDIQRARALRNRIISVRDVLSRTAVSPSLPGLKPAVSRPAFPKMENATGAVSVMGVYAMRAVVINAYRIARWLVQVARAIGEEAVAKRIADEELKALQKKPALASDKRIASQTVAVKNLMDAGVERNAAQKIAAQAAVSESGEAFDDMVFTLEIFGETHAIPVAKGADVMKAVTAYVENNIKGASQAAALNALRDIGKATGQKLRYEIAFSVGNDGSMCGLNETALVINDTGGYDFRSKVDIDNDTQWLIHSHPVLPKSESEFDADKENLKEIFGAGSIVLLPGGDMRVLARPNRVAQDIGLTITHTMPADKSISANAPEVIDVSPSISGMLAKLKEYPTANNGTRILAFSAPSVGASAIGMVKALGDSRSLRLVAFGDEKDRLRMEALGFIFVTRTAEATISEDIMSAKELRGMDIDKIAVAVTGTLIDNTRDDVYKDLNSSKLIGRQLPSYVILDKDLKNSKAVEVNLANLLRSVMRDEPCVVVVGFGGSDKAFGDIQRLLAGIGFFKVVDSIGRALKEIYDAIRATATSV